ncbi:hypothetical protein EYC84_000895 [Monilinia fructicola]|uniref:Uncharacterized protein n=1 Tax=Monilinia fructicola TaxID=38448 RepID=A0A5M9JIA5_MONFR|nr:hypothetical protein EYC84_000895 [Monilinia fructicola]
MQQQQQQEEEEKEGPLVHFPTHILLRKDPARSGAEDRDLHVQIVGFAYDSPSSFPYVLKRQEGSGGDELEEPDGVEEEEVGGAELGGGFVSWV